ncbi:uncharacterized protein LOC134817547 [Bolinopsis microptera]|uniref:uncharacterized protein LOC134817547 n=1 Tax=Bolinopsis microptera TaxID=2820187 RepID=UPI00307AE1C1
MTKITLLLITLSLLVVSGFATDSKENIEPTTTPTISYNETHPPSNNTTVVKSPNPLTLNDLQSSGTFLLLMSLIFVLVNGFLVGIVVKNWERISDSVYYNSTLLCMLLTSSDFALSLLLGLPIGIRLTFEKQLRENKFLVYYTEDIGYLLFEYLYILRVIVVAVISAERCLHILRPFKYMMIATKGRVKIVCWIIVILPLLRIAPVIYALSADDTYVHCTYYSDDGKDSGYHTPLTCMLDMRADKLPGFEIADIAIMCSLIGISWLTILVSNIFILVVIFDKAFDGYITRQYRVDMNLKLMKCSVVVLLISSSFALTNFPYAYAWTAHIFGKDKNYRQHFYLILLAFLSLFFHPWFYCLRMKNIRDLVTGFKQRVHSFKTNSRASTTSIMVMSTVRRSTSMPQTTKEYTRVGSKDLVGPTAKVPIKESSA